MGGGLGKTMEQKKGSRWSRGSRPSAFVGEKEGTSPVVSRGGLERLTLHNTSAATRKSRNGTTFLDFFWRVKLAVELCEIVS